MRVPSWAPDWERAMGYRKFLKDYEIRQEPQADGKVKKVRVYVGLYYRFTAAPEEVAQVRRRLPWLLLAQAVTLLLPMLFPSQVVKPWYVLMPHIAAWLPLLLLLEPAWLLKKAKTQVERQESEILYDRFAGASLFLMVFTFWSAAGALGVLFSQGLAWRDALATVLLILAAAVSTRVFACRKQLKMEPIPRESQEP